MSNIQNALDSEYNNAGELMGLDGALNGELLGYLAGLDAVTKAQVIQKLTRKPPVSSRSRAEFEKHFKELPNGVKEKLLKGELRLADYMIYSVKQITSKTVKFFETQDNKEAGLRSISNGKLQKNQVFLVTGIYLLAGIPTDLTADKIKATDFGSIKNYPAIANGEHYLKSNKVTLIPENSTNRKFITDNNTTNNLGFFKLDNPRLIKDDELIEFVMELGTMDGLDAKTHAFVALDGTGTTP